MMSTGIAEDVIRRAAEFGGDKPMVVAGALMGVTAVLFTSLTGLGAIIMVGSLVLPIMMSLGVPRRLTAILFLLAFATGFIFNIALWRLYRELLQLAPGAPLPREIVQFASVLAGDHDGRGRRLRGLGRAPRAGTPTVGRARRDPDASPACPGRRTSRRSCRSSCTWRSAGAKCPRSWPARSTASC